jgi:bifunctional non-homologous end joining protein LigD
VLTARSTVLRLSEEVDAEGADFLKLACAMKLEGIIAAERPLSIEQGW